MINWHETAINLSWPNRCTFPSFFWTDCGKSQDCLSGQNSNLAFTEYQHRTLWLHQTLLFIIYSIYSLLVSLVCVL